MEKAMDYLGIDLLCATDSLRRGHFPAKDCLFPLLTNLLSYFLVAASMTVKLPQVVPKTLIPTPRFTFPKKI